MLAQIVGTAFHQDHGRRALAGGFEAEKIRQIFLEKLVWQRLGGGGVDDAFSGAICRRQIGQALSRSGTGLDHQPPRSFVELLRYFERQIELIFPNLKTRKTGLQGPVWGK